MILELSGAVLLGAAIVHLVHLHYNRILQKKTDKLIAHYEDDLAAAYRVIDTYGVIIEESMTNNLREALEASELMMIIHDRDHKIVDITDSTAGRLFGKPAIDVKGKRLADLERVTGIVQKGTQTAEEFRQLIMDGRGHIRTRWIPRINWRNYKGELRQYELVINARMRGAEEVVGTITFIRDITGELPR